MRPSPALLLLVAATLLASSACNRDGRAQDAGLTSAYAFALPELPPDGVDRQLIDAHTHLFGVGVWPDIEALMQQNGLDYLVNLSGGSPRRGMGQALEIAEASGGRVLNAMTVNWAGFGEPAWGEIVAEELELCVTRYGYVGVKISKALGLGLQDLDGSLVAVDDARLFPIWERAGTLGVPVYIHTGDPAAFWEPATPANERYDELLAHPNWSFAGPQFPPREELLAQLERVFARFPGTTFVSVHFGNNPEELDYVGGVLERYPNVYVDLAARVPEVGRHEPERVRELFVRFQDRILFATDIAIGRTPEEGLVLVLGSSGAQTAGPGEVAEFFNRHFRYLETDARGMGHPTPIQGRWTIDAIALPEEVLDKVYWQNAYDLVVGPALARRGG
jgi:predicted TIM-barrel fold metal-dependent hydrolase